MGFINIYLPTCSLGASSRHVVFLTTYFAYSLSLQTSTLIKTELSQRTSELQENADVCLEKDEADMIETNGKENVDWRMRGYHHFRNACSL